MSNVLETLDDGSVRGLLERRVHAPGSPPARPRAGCIAESLRLLRDEGATSAFLGVDTGNHNRAIDLYQSCGFEVVSSGTPYRRPFDQETP